MGTTFTNAQRAAINDRSNHILVSAAAGSGKTTVLAERVLQRLIDPVAPLDLRRLLIVTFTKESAADLRKKIGNTLKKELQLHPERRDLQTQLYQLPAASISTIDSFYYTLVRDNFEQLGVSASLQILDTTEADLLAEQCMNEVLDGYYDGVYDDIDDFHTFVEIFCDKTDVNIASDFLSLYKKLNCYTEGIEFIQAEYLRQKASASDFSHSSYGEILWESLSQQLAVKREKLLTAHSYYAAREHLHVRLPAFADDITFLEQLLFHAKKRDAVAFLTRASNYTPTSVGRLASGACTDLEKAEDKRWTEFRNKKIKAFLKELPEACPLFWEEGAQKGAILAGAEALSLLYHFFKRFRTQYETAKQKKNALDFNNLSTLALRLLVDESGAPTENAIRLSMQFDEIYIDEYQDVNNLQDTIFSALSCRSHRFMVGDIKQSIYGFRGSDPASFSRYRAEFQPLQTEEDAAYRDPSPIDKRLIFLSHNFRSDAGILQTCNTVFSYLFPAVNGCVTYLEQDNLRTGDKNRKDNMLPATVALLPTKTETGENAELVYIANKIKSLLADGVAPSQIAILLRSKTRSSEYESFLLKQGIPVESKEAANFFENPEVLLFLSFLRTIDAPRQDISLAATLKSPLFGFTLAELADIRAQQRDLSLYDALCNYTEVHDFQKGRAFLEALQRYREYARQHTVDKLIWYLWHDTAFLAMVGATEDPHEAKLRQANLLMLYDHARKMEQSAFGGLHAFVRYMDKRVQSDADMENLAGAVEKKDNVRILSIHASKGLEFDYVFVASCQKALNTAGQKKGSKGSRARKEEKIYFSHTHGIGFNMRSNDGLVAYATPQRVALHTALISNAIDEEIRLLYVALTRAKKQVFLTAASTDPQKVLKLCMESASFSEATLGMLIDRPSYIDWVLIALAHSCQQNGTDITEATYPFTLDMALPSSTAATAPVPTSTAQGKVAQTDRQAELRALFLERFAFRYPHASPLQIPAKLSVSDLHPSILDAINADATPSPQKTEFLMDRPLFLQEKQADTTVSSAERGTATHVFMQFCDFDQVKQHGVYAEAKRLVDEKFIPLQYAELIRYEELERFFQSELFAKLERATMLRREMRFNIPLPAADFTTDAEARAALSGEHVLVQGVIDCLFTDASGELWLVDYKTDRLAADLSDSAVTKLLRDRHGTQLSYYAEAIRRICKRSPDHICIFAFSLGRTVVL